MGNLLDLSVIVSKWYGTVWYGMVRCTMVLVKYGMVWNLDGESVGGREEY